MHGMEATQKFAQAQMQCGRMWHAMRYARLNLTEVRARRFATRAQIVEAVTMVNATRRKYFQALEELYACERCLRQIG